jgi:DNA-binding MarR family transcriptional regulator
MATPAATLGERVDAVRRFNRFYTRRIGVIEEALAGSPFSLTEARILYELAHRKGPTATVLGKELGLDPGYLSRILRQFRRRGLVARERSEADGRQSLLTLTDRGREAFAALNVRSSDDVSAMLGPLPAEAQERLVRAMGTIEDLLEPRTETKAPFILRPPEAGDYGRVVELHGRLYAREYGWDETFEALVAGIVARYAEKHDEKRERCWIAERNEEVVGCVFLVRKSEKVVVTEDLVGNSDEPIRVLRFANRVPLLHQQAACAITKCVTDCESAQPIDPTMNTPTALANTSRGPKRSAVQPLAGMNTASDSR